MLLYLSACSELVESTFSHPRENVNLEIFQLKKVYGDVSSHHRVYPVLLVPLGERDHLNTERQEGSVEESVHQEHLTFPRDLNKM